MNLDINKWERVERQRVISVWEEYLQSGLSLLKWAGGYGYKYDRWRRQFKKHGLKIPRRANGARPPGAISERDNEAFDRWLKGESKSSIARDLGIKPASMWIIITRVSARRGVKLCTTCRQPIERKGDE